MPSGYTAAIAKGITFKEYALGCARAFGALVLMRDEPNDAPIPERFEPTDYHTNALTNASDRLVQLRLMSPDECALAAEKDFEAVRQKRAAAVAEKTELRNKYNAILAQAMQWEPPTPAHVEYKNFMVKQLRDSIEWDCDTSYDDESLIQLSGSEWLAGQIAAAEREIEYHKAQHLKEVRLTNERNDWIKALRDALP